MKRIFLITTSIYLLCSCGEPIMQYETSVKTPIVETYLMQGQNNISMRVYSMESFEDNATFSNPIKGLSIYLNDELMNETSTTGTYSLQLKNSTIESNTDYQLRFSYNGKNISAQTTIPGKPTGLSISESIIYRNAYSGFWGNDTISVIVSWNDPDKGYYQVYINALDATSTENQHGFGGRGPGQMMMQPFQGNTYTLKPQDFSYFGYYRFILYKVNPDYVELYERISATDLANPVSFIENGLGIFTAISSDTIYYRVVETE